MHTYHDLDIFLAELNMLSYLILTTFVFPHLFIHKLRFGEVKMLLRSLARRRVQPVFTLKLVSFSSSCVFVFNFLKSL